MWLIASAVGVGIVIGIVIGFVLTFGLVKIYDWIDETERAGRHL